MKYHQEKLLYFLSTVLKNRSTFTNRKNVCQEKKTHLSKTHSSLTYNYNLI